MIANILMANGIRATVRPYTHAVLPDDVDIAVETDSSIHGSREYEGVTQIPIEIKTRILNGCDDWERTVPKMLSIISYLGGRVNATCGHHVHLGIPEVGQRPAVIRSLYNLFHRFEPVILGSLVSPSRRGNHHCRPMSDMPKALHGCKTLLCFRRGLGHLGRYHGVNWTHLFGSNPHLEIRYHQGTLDPVKARHWLRFCLQMIEHAVVNRSCQAGRQAANDKNGINRLLTSVGFRPNSQIYRRVSKEIRETGRYLLLKRFRRFNGRTC